MARNKKSPYWTSATGRKPASAAPIATPAMAASEMGVSMTRRWPNSSANPSVTVKAPPNPPSTPMSSPSRMTLSSRRISSRSASRSAATREILREESTGGAGTLFGEDIGQTILRLRAGALLGKGHGLVQLSLDGGFDFRLRLG